MMSLSRFAAPLAAILLLAGCQAGGEGPGTKQTFGALGGGALGGLLGSQVGGGKGQLAATAVGVLLGAYAGSELGSSLDRADRMYATQAQQQAYRAPVGQPITWNNPESGHSGTITPVRDGQNTATGEYCREYQTTINVGGKTEQAYGTACRQPDGSWRVIK